MDESDVDEDTPTRPINAYFESKLPDILNEISTTLIGVEPLLKDAEIRVRELHDYLKFEIDKAHLEIAKHSSTDPSDEQAHGDRLWLNKLEYIVFEYDPKSTVSSVEFLKELRKELKATFMRD